MPASAARAWEAWKAWLDTTLPLWPLTVFRVVVGLTVAWESGHNKARVIQYTAGQYHLPIVPGLGGFDPAMYERICDLQFWAGMALAVGFVPRLAAVAAFALQGALFATSLLNFRNHIYLTLVFLGLLAFAPIHRGVGVMGLLRWLPRWFRNERLPAADRQTRATAWRLVQITTISVYFWATFHKVLAGFHSGFALSRELPRYVRNGPLPVWMREREWAAYDWLMEAVADAASMRWLAMVTLLVEGAIALGLIWRRTRWPAVLLGVALHAGIAAFANIYSFGTLLVGSYFLFLFDRPVRVAPVGEGGGVAEAEEEADSEGAAVSEGAADAGSGASSDDAARPDTSNRASSRKRGRGTKRRRAR